MMQSFQVDQSQEGIRLDLFLSQALSLSRKKAKSLLDAGRVQVGSKKVIIASWELKAGETVKVLESSAASGQRLERYLKIHYEDSDLLVVEKPAGVACEKTGQVTSSTLVDDINDYLKRAHPDKPYPYVGLMHRLDRQTSGLMVYTLNKRANKLSLDFKEHRLVRRYLALVEGSGLPDHGRIDRAIKKDSSGKKMIVFQSKSPSLRAITEYQVKQRFKDSTLVEATLHTGRTHQVRVHFSSLGHPVVGDKLYGSKSKVARHFLHASYLELTHPLSGKRLKFRSPLPKDFKSYVEKKY
ncbi:MAG: RluA family pseudouridine synthase [Deltaproteobacteria bacterium]|nr:RluA family pseudouridine synthase [Deltaproteobacteria bacterium]